MRKLFAVFFLIFLGCAVTQKKVEVTPPEKKQEVQEETPLIKAESIRDLSEIIKGSRIYSEKGKIVFYSSEKKNAEELRKRLMKQFPNSLTAEEIGFENYKKEDIVSQLDSRNIPVFISVDSRNGVEILLEIISVENGEKETKKVICPFLKEEKSSSEFVMNIFTDPKSVCWAENKDIIISDEKKISVVDIAEKTEKTIDVFVCEGVQLSNFGEGAVCFCPQTGKGLKFENKNGIFEKKETQSFPLPERIMRFINVEKDENGFWALFDRKGDLLGEFVCLSKFVFRGTTVFLSISPQGELWGLRGDLVEPIYPKEKIKFKKICSSDTVAYGLSESGELYKISISGDFSILIEKKQVDISEEMINIAAVENNLYIFVKRENNFGLYKITENGD
ncbi:MAG: hypothetical protein GYA35_00540 [Thermoanaerobaculaceae bacterium]|nr:hypothetical protein [Thermoanaerobaculaceae bacterium]